MIKNDQELRASLERMHRFQGQITQLRHAETNPANYALSAAGYQSELDRMNVEVREYLSLLDRED